MKAVMVVKLKFIQSMAAILFLTLSAKAQLSADFTANATKGCSPLAVQFSDQTTGNPTQWHWDLGNGTLSSQKNPSATYFNPGIYPVKLIVTNAAGTDSIIKTQYITVFDNPVVAFNGVNLSGCYPLNTSFSDISSTTSGVINTWQWDFGDGNISSQQNPSHTYTSLGQFDVKLKVVSDKGCFNAISKNAYVTTTGGVKADFSFVSTGSCQPPVAVNFTNNSSGTGLLSYQWDLGDGNFATTKDVVHNYANVGSYTVKLIVTNNSGCSDLIIKSNLINIGTVKANFVMVDTICAGIPINITNTSTPATVSSLWIFDDATTDNQINPIKIFSTPGTHTVKLVNDFGSCKDSTQKNIEILAKPSVSFSANNNIGCSVPLNVQFTNAIGGGTYAWDFSDGNTSTLQSPAHDFTQAGNYDITLTITNSNGCSNTKTLTNLVSISRPKITSITSLPNKGCAPLTVQSTSLVNSIENVANWYWDFGDGITSTDTIPTHTYTTEGFFDIKLIITTTGGCTDTLLVKEAVKVGHKPNADFMVTPRENCAYSGLTFTDLSTNGRVDDWHWFFGDGDGSFDSVQFHQYRDTGFFDIQLIVGNNGCYDTLIRPNYVHIKPPVADFIDTLTNCTNKRNVLFLDKSKTNTNYGAITYNWDFGDGNTSNNQNPTHTYASNGTYTVTLLVTNGSCSHSKTKTFTFDDRPGDISVSDSIACKNTRINFAVNNLSTENIIDYTWNTGDGNILSSVGAAMVWDYKQAGNYNIVLVTTDKYNCKDTLQYHLPLTIYGPKANFASSKSFSCSNSTINFYDASNTDGLHPILNWQWNYGDGNTVNYSTAPFSHNYTVGGTFAVALKVTDSYGCADSLNVPNTITIGKSVAAFTESDTSICPSTNVQFTNQSTGNNISSFWSFGDGNNVATVSPAHAYTNQGIYTVKLFVNDPNGCSDSVIKVNRIHVFKPVASFIASDTFATCPPLLVHFTNASIHNTTTVWTLDKTDIPVIDTPSHLYIYPGIYKVKLVVTNNGGCADSAFKQIKVLGPTGVFTYVPNIACNPVAVTFSAAAQNTKAYTWDYDNGVTKNTTVNSSVYTYTAMGHYLPKLILEDASGCKVGIKGLDTIKVKGIETNIAGKPVVVCDSGYTNFKDSSITNDIIKSYLWNFGDGKTSTQQNPSHHYNTNGLYNVQLIVTTNNGCKDTAIITKAVKVLSTPKLVVNGVTPACVTSTFTFTSSIANPDTSAIKWQWNFGNGNTSTAQNPTPQTYTQGGSYTITGIATNSSGCADTSKKTLTVYALPIVDAGSDVTICRFKSQPLTPTGAQSYTWATNSTLSCTNCSNTIATPTADAVYYVTGKSGFGCIATDSVKVKVQQHLVMAVAKGDTLCLGEKTTLTASGTQQYQWSPSLYVNNPTAAQVTVFPAKDTTITYRVIGSDNMGCFFDTGYAKVRTYPIPKFEIDKDNITLNVGSKIQLETQNSKDITSWKWLPAKWLDNATVAKPTTSASESITYTCIAKNDGDCAARDQIKINVICNGANIFVPNTFSPNSDGMNDVFYPRGKGLFTIKSMRIFNRWGEMIFERTNFSPNDASAGWDGTHKGVKVPADVYVFAVEVECDNSTTIPTKGDITLLR